MEEKAFATLVDRLEAYSFKHPIAYKVRIALLAVLGYLYLFGIVAGILFVVAAILFYGSINFLVLKFLLIPLGIAAVVLRSLWVTFPEPEGHELFYADAPHLFELVKEVRKATHGPRVHKTLLSDEFNAGIIQRPRLGIFGWQQNYLVIGLPLLNALTVADIRSVIAHEFGHLSGNHGRFSGWIYRVRQTWVQILTTMKQDKRYASGLFEPFFNWYAPFFGAYSFVLARAQEYEADRRSVDISGREAAARALVNVQIKSHFLNEAFWPELLSSADRQPEPPVEPFNVMLAALKQPVARDNAQLWFSRALVARHDYDDTHPSLADRLRAIGYSPESENPEFTLFQNDEVGSRGEVSLLESLPAEWLAGRNRLWTERVALVWRERHKYVVEGEKELAALNEKAGTTELTLDEQWKRARLLFETEGFTAAQPRVLALLEAQADHAGANFLLGQALLDQGDEVGIQHIELAMKQELDAVSPGCERIYLFLKAQGRSEEADVYRKRLAKHCDEIDRAKEERTGIAVGDEFRPHDLPAETIAAIREQLSRIAPLHRAFLVRKVVRYFPDERQYILGVLGKYPLFTLHTKRADSALVSLVASEVVFPGSTLIVAIEQRPRVLLDAIVGVPGAEIYHS